MGKENCLKDSTHLTSNPGWRHEPRGETAAKNLQKSGRKSVHSNKLTRMVFPNVWQTFLHAVLLGDSSHPDFQRLDPRLISRLSLLSFPVNCLFLPLIRFQRPSTPKNQKQARVLLPLSSLVIIFNPLTSYSPYVPLDRDYLLFWFHSMGPILDCSGPFTTVTSIYDDLNTFSAVQMLITEENPIWNFSKTTWLSLTIDLPRLIALSPTSLLLYSAFEIHLLKTKATAGISWRYLLSLLQCLPWHFIISCVKIFFPIYPWFPKL